MDTYDPKKDLYLILGVPDDASTDDIRRTFKTKARLAHPDGHREPELATREMQALSEAHSVLGNAARRRAYDEQRAAYRLRSMQPEIDRRVAEAVADAQRRTTARADDVRARGKAARARTANVRAHGTSTSRAPVPAKPTQPSRPLGLFERIAEPQVDDLVRKNKPVDAAIWTVGAVLLDAWLGTGPRTPRPPTKPRRRRRT